MNGSESDGDCDGLKIRIMLGHALRAKIVEMGEKRQHEWNHDRLLDMFGGQRLRNE
jgi:hypothetical protein